MSDELRKQVEGVLGGIHDIRRQDQAQWEEQRRKNARLRLIKVSVYVGLGLAGLTLVIFLARFLGLL